MPEAGPSPEESLWRFSFAFYALPEVARALIALQDGEDLDVNLILFALWLGVSGRGRLRADALKAAERAIGTVRYEVVKPLRSLRRRLKDIPEPDIQQLRERVKALELAGEKLVQARLARLAEPALGDIPARDRCAAAGANLVLYLGPEGAHSAEAMVIREALESFMESAASGL